MPRGRRSQKKSGGYGREKDGGKHGVKRGEAERQKIALAALEVDAARLGGGGKRFGDADDAQRHGNGQNLQIGRKRAQLFPRRGERAARKRRAYPAIRGRPQEQRRINRKREAVIRCGDGDHRHEPEQKLRRRV